MARIGYKRSQHRVNPGLYSLGKPTADSPVFVTANYTLSFDALRSALDGVDGYILVLDTKGINVWCAAGKGTFGTQELVKQVKNANLQDVVKHRKLIIPQLGAPGIAAHEVKKTTGFKVEYGPVRTSDLPEYLKTRKATPEMRMVRFDLKDRLTLIPVEIINYLIYVVPIAIVLFLLGGFHPLSILLVIVFSGAALFPALLPWLPTRDFTSKGLILGGIVSIPFIIDVFLKSGSPSWLLVVYAIIPVLLISPWVAYLSLNFTGSTTFTSRTGVRREIFRYIPILAIMFISGIALNIILGVLDNMGVL